MSPNPQETSWHLRYINGVPRIYETFFDSMHIKGRPTDQTIRKTILERLENNGTKVAEWKTQAYDGVKVMRSEISGVATFIKKQQPLAGYTHCRGHAINHAITFACKNKSVQTFMDNLTTVCYFFLIIHGRGSNTLNYSLIFTAKSYS